MDLRRRFGGPAPKESSSLIFTGRNKASGRDTEKETKMERERQRVGTNVCCVTGPLQHPWTLSKTQSHTLLQTRAMKIFFLMFTKTYLFISRHSVIYLFISRCPSTPCSATGILFDDADVLTLPSFAPPTPLLIPLQLKIKLL